jgi:hypothetical protein
MEACAALQVIGAVGGRRARALIVPETVSELRHGRQLAKTREYVTERSQGRRRRVYVAELANAKIAHCDEFVAQKNDCAIKSERPRKQIELSAPICNWPLSALTSGGQITRLCGPERFASRAGSRWSWATMKISSRLCVGRSAGRLCAGSSIQQQPVADEQQQRQRSLAGF